MAPNGRLVKGQYKPICRDCAMYFSTTVNGFIDFFVVLLEGIFGKWGRKSQMVGGNDSPILSHIFHEMGLLKRNKNDG